MFAEAIDEEKARRYRKESTPENEDTCTMCGKMCSMRTMKKIMSGEDLNILKQEYKMAEINGKYEEINDVNLLDYLIENKYRVDRVVIDYNGEIVKKAEFSKINIKKYR